MSLRIDRPAPAGGAFSKALDAQMRVLSALMIREGITHYGHENLGFFWVMGEPLVLSVGVMIMWAMIGMTHGHSEVGLVPFALSSYTLLTLWRHIVNRSVHSLRNNASLLFHREVRVLDILIARALLDALGTLAAFFVAYVPLCLFGAMDPLADPLLVIGAWALQGWFAFSVALLIAGLSEIFEAVEQFVGPLLYITLPISGAFYLVDWLPSNLQTIVLWSPLVDINEMFRAGVFGPQVIRSDWSATFPALCSLVITPIGLVVVRKSVSYVRIG